MEVQGVLIDLGQVRLVRLGFAFGLGSVHVIYLGKAKEVLGITKVKL
jgi:hypothetical protein